jgi:hypothetical protein
MAESCEAAECHIICPVEPTVVSWVFHPFRPIVLALQVVCDLAAARIVHLLGLLLLHEGFVHFVQLCSLLLVLRLHLVDEVGQFFGCTLSTDRGLDLVTRHCTPISSHVCTIDAS